MSITMVGPFPGPFNQAHYSDSSSDSQQYPSPGRPSPLVPSQPQSQPRSAAPEGGSQIARHESVLYSPAQPNFVAPRPVRSPTYPDLPRLRVTPNEAPPRPRNTALTKRRCCELLWRLAAVAAATVVVALLVAALRSRQWIQPKVAPMRGVNLVSGVNGTASPSTSSSSATAEEQERPGHNTDAITGGLEGTRRGHRAIAVSGADVGEARKAFPWASSTREIAEPTTAASTARVATHDPELRGEDDSSAPALRATAATSASGAATRIDTTAAVLMATPTTVAKTRELAATSSVHKPDVAGDDSAVGFERRKAREALRGHDQ